jgi:glycosyltransferase involved in cell wall biosynthesis
MPKISCIVPCFNESSEILEDCFRSLSSQTFADFECILIDESTNIESSLQCERICKLDTRFTYIRPEKRIGLAGSLNLGIAASKGKYIARFDSDDICIIERFALQSEFLDKNPEIGIVGGFMEIVDEEGVLIGLRNYPITHKEIQKKFIFSNALAHPTVMIRKSALSISGREYDPAFKFAEDLELWLGLLNKGVMFANLPVVLVRYRQQTSTRYFRNWVYNVKARIKNFSTPYVFLKIFGIMAIIIWSLMPKSLQVFIFRKLQFRR